MGCASSRLAVRAADKAKELLSSPTHGVGLSSSVTDEAKPRFTDDGTGINGPLGSINGPMLKGAGSRTFEPETACLPFRDISNELLSGGIPREVPSPDLGSEPSGGPSEGLWSQSMAPADSSASVDDDVTPASSGSLNKRKSLPNLGLPAPDLVAALEGWGVLNEDLKEALMLRRSKS